MTPRPRLRAGAPIDLAKRDQTFSLGGRTFAVRAHLDGRHPAGPGWHAVIVEQRTPLDHGLVPTADAEACLAAAVGFLTTAVAAEAIDRGDEATWEAEGGALPERGMRRAAVPRGVREEIRP